MKILIVDDSRAMQTIVRRGIEQLGYDEMEMRKADNGKLALDIIRTWEPDLVLSDWHMPEMSGIELLKALNRQMLTTQIGFVTTETSPARKQEALEAGAKFFVQKPFDYHTLHEAVLPLLQGNSDGEAALSESQQATEQEEPNQVAITDVDTLSNILSHFSKAQLLVEETEPMALKEHDFPCLLGLFEYPETKKVRAVAIMNVNATCILGAAITAIPEERVRQAIQQKAVPKAMLGNCKKLMEAFASTLYDKETLKPMQLRSINIMRRNVDSIEKLLQKNVNERIDVEVAVQGYGSGNLTVLAS